MESTNKNEMLEKIGKRIDEAIDISKNIENFKEGWEKLKEIQNELKNFDGSQELKDQLWLPLKDSFERIKKREKEFFNNRRKQQDENFSILKPIVEEAVLFTKENDNLKEVWTKLISVQKRFKGLSLPKDKHQKLWDMLQDSFVTLKNREEEQYELQKDNWDENYLILSRKVEEIKDVCENEMFFKKAWDKIKELRHEFTVIKTDKLRENELLNELQKHISKLKKRQEERKEEIEKIKEGGFDKLNRLCNRALNEAKTNKNLKDVFERLKEWQRDVFTNSRYLDSQEEKDTLKAKLDEAFSVYKSRQEEFFKSKKEEWRIKQEEFLATMIEKKEKLSAVTIPKIQKSIIDSKEYLKKIKLELEEKKSIDENDKKVQFLTEKIQKVENELIEKDKSILDINKKIDGISKTILGVQDKLNSKK